jgi:alkylation response protein AidB-like acyl-CoA dehydrogenase
MDFSPFNQSPPELGNQYDDDRPLRSIVARLIPKDARARVEESLRAMGELAGGELYRMSLEDRLNEPTLTQWSPYGERIDRIEVTKVWQRGAEIVPTHGVIATAYERKLGALSRVHQFALAYLFNPSSDVYTCPLAMTDGAARTLLASGNTALIDRAVPRLTSRDPKKFWTSGQWMTESTGGSDVGKSETVATQEKDGSWRLWGRKWFTSATTSEMTLTLGRPEGNAPGGRGLALFYVETRDENGRLRHIEVNRLKDKLGTRKVPTAELMLRGTPAIPVVGLENGIKNITPMLNVTRTWNTICSVSAMRRGLALARSYAKKRVAFGAPLSEKPLHLDTLADLAAETEGAVQLAFLAIEVLGRIEAGETRPHDETLLRLLTPIAKLTTGKQVVATCSEVLECFGGAGYVEDTGLPVLLRDAQVLPIWEGTTNVLSLDTLRAVGHGPDVVAALEALLEERVGTIADAELRAVGEKARTAIRRANGWLAETFASAPLDVEASARRYALTLGRSLELALLAHHADWSLANEKDARAKAAALRFARSPFDLLSARPRDESALLALD